MKLRKRSVIIIATLAILVITTGFYFWWINSPKYSLGVTNVKIYSITKTTERWVPGPFTEEQEKEIEVWRKKEEDRREEYLQEYLRTHGIEGYLRMPPELTGFDRTIPPDLWDTGHTEYDTVTTGKGITGELINRANREFSNIDIEFAIYNTPDNQIGKFSIHIDNLQSHKTYRFDTSLGQSFFDGGASYCDVIRITTK